MSDIKFSCPHCDQHIQCEPGYAGMEIGCPRCGGRLVVPGQVAPPPPPSLALSTAASSAPPRPQPRSLPGASVALPKKAASADKWYANPNVLLGILLVLFGGLYLWARTGQTGALVFVGLQAIYGLGVGIFTLVLAFKESAGTGFMTLCIPCYSLYFVYGLSENPLLKALFTVSILTSAASGTLRGALE